MSLKALPNIWGYATASLYGKEAHFVTSAASPSPDTWADALSSSTPCTLATAITGASGLTNKLILIMDDGIYNLSADTTFPNGTVTDRNVWAGTTDIPAAGTPQNNGMPVFDFGAGAFSLFTGSSNWVENIKCQNNTGTGNELFEALNNGTNFHYKCWGDLSVNAAAFGGGNAGKFIGCRATNCAGGLGSGSAGIFAYCYADLCSSGYDMGVNNTLFGCISSNHTVEGFRTNNNGMLMVQCTSDGGDIAGSTGLETESNDMVLAMFCHFSNNDTQATLDHANNDGNIMLINCNLFDSANKTGDNTISVNETTVDPGYADPSTVDFTPSAASVINVEVGSSHDDDSVSATEGMQGRSSFVDVGAIQLQCSGNVVSVGGDASNYFEDQLMDYTFRAGYDFQTANVYLALYTSNPDEDNTGTEVSGNGYARQSISFGSPSNGTTSNDVAIAFPASTGSWGTITHFAIFDAETSGNMLAYADLYPDASVATNQQVTVAVGQVQITVD